MLLACTFVTEASFVDAWLVPILDPVEFVLLVTGAVAFHPVQIDTVWRTPILFWPWHWWRSPQFLVKRMLHLRLGAPSASVRDGR